MDNQNLPTPAELRTVAAEMARRGLNLYQNYPKQAREVTKALVASKTLDGPVPFVPKEPVVTYWRSTCDLRYNMGVLEQAWINDDASKKEWRPIPSVAILGPSQPGHHHDFHNHSVFQSLPRNQP